MTDLNNRREADSNAYNAADSSSARRDAREEHADDAVKERFYPYIEPPEDWARMPIGGKRG